MSPEKLLALYHFCTAWHGGQWSREYRIGCRVSKVFTPARREEYLAVLSESEYSESRDYYLQLVKSTQGEGTSGYATCTCCSHAFMVDDTRAENGVTMCDDCQENDCRSDSPCEVECAHDEESEVDA